MSQATILKFLFKNTELMKVHFENEISKKKWLIKKIVIDSFIHSFILKQMFPSFLEVFCSKNGLTPSPKSISQSDIFLSNDPKEQK